MVKGNKEGTGQTVLNPVVNVARFPGVGAADEFLIYASEEIVNGLGDFGFKGDDIGHGVYTSDGLFQFCMESLICRICKRGNHFSVLHLCPYTV